MDKNLVYRLTYETIVDSLPDFIDLENDDNTKRNFISFVDGITEMASSMLNYINNKDSSLLKERLNQMKDFILYIYFV